jgi:putative endonuclease
VGVTNDLIRRVREHKARAIRGFSQKYRVDKLVYFEEHGDVSLAIYREKCLKKWFRKWKVALIEEQNPEWKDLYEGFV